MTLVILSKDLKCLPLERDFIHMLAHMYTHMHIQTCQVLDEP